MSKPTLAQVLTGLLDGHIAGSVELSGGLRLQFKAADTDNPDGRLCAYRVGIQVGTVELGTLRRHLEELLPPGTAVTLDPDEQTVTGRDGRARHYRVFRWPGQPAAQQLSLLGEEGIPSSPRRGNNYGAR